MPGKLKRLIEGEGNPRGGEKVCLDIVNRLEKVRKNKSISIYLI